MKNTNKLFSFLVMISFFLLSACGGQQSADVPSIPNADNVVTFNAEGLAVLRGYIRSSGFSAKKSTFTLETPVKADGIKANLSMTINIPYTTEVSSSKTSHTNVREYLIFNPGSVPSSVFPVGALVDITFQKKGSGFEAVSVREVTSKFPIFQSRPAIKNVFPIISPFNGAVAGHIYTSTIIKGVPVYWGVSIPIYVHDIEAAVTLTVYSAKDTQLIMPNGVVPLTSSNPFGDVSIEFTRIGSKLTAWKITELP